MINNIIHSEKISQLKSLFWQGQPVYKQYAKLKNYIKQHLGEEFSAIFAEPHIADEDSATKTYWTSESVNETAVPFTSLSATGQTEISKNIETKLSVIQDFYQELLEAESSEQNKWGQLVNKAIEVPDKKYVLVQGDKFVLVFWGFENPGSQSSNYSIKKDFVRGRISYRDYKRSNEKTVEDTPGEAASIDTGIQNTEVSEEKDETHRTTSNVKEELPKDTEPAASGSREPVPSPPPPVVTGKDKTKKHWFKRFWWLRLLLIIALLFLFWLLRKKDGSATILPAQPGKIVPIDSTKIIKDPDNIKSIVSDRLNIALTGANKDIMVFAEKFKKAYPGNEYQIIYYDTVTHRIQVQVPAEGREPLKAELKSKMTDYEMLIWYESIMQSNKEPNDPAFTDINKDWYHRDVKAIEAWDITQGDSGIVIAILDDGFDLNHPEFQGKIYKPWNIPAGNAQVNTGRNSIHGTHVAGIALALADNGIGACGIAPKCRFMPVQVADYEGRMGSTAIIDGLLYAIDNGANVINMSLGMQASDQVANLSPQMQMDLINRTFKEEEAFWDQLFEIAANKNIIVVLAAGNQNIVIGVDPMERSNKTIKVSAVDLDNQKADFSNYGNLSTISAPGVHIYSSIPNHQFTYLDGTSMAAPIVTGGVALIKSVNPSLTFNQVVDLIQSTGIPVNSPQYIGNILQLDKAVGIANNNRQKMPVVDCPDIQTRIDSLLQEIEKLRQQCSQGIVTKDTLKIPPSAKDPTFAAGRWKSTSYLFNSTDGKKVTLYFDFASDGTGKITLVESDNTTCEAALQLGVQSGVFSIVQQGAAACQPPPEKYQPYVFKCKPDANGCAECEAQNRNKSNNNFKFNLVKIN